MIREFETDLDLTYVDGKHVHTWNNKKISVNARFVASVRPYTDQSATICMAGSYNFVVRGSYDDVVAWWLEAINA